MEPIGIAALLVGMAGFAASAALRGPRRMVVKSPNGHPRRPWGPRSHPSFAGNPTTSPLSVASSWLTVATVILGFLFGLSGRAVVPLGLRPRVAVAIPSQADFSRDMRRGLLGKLQPLHHAYYDEFQSTLAAQEDLPGFPACLHEALEFRPDFLVVAAPNSAMLVTAGR